MKTDRFLGLAVLIFAFPLFCHAQIPIIENVRFEQRTDGSFIVDIYYDVTSVSDLPLEILVEASDDNGTSWNLNCSSLNGDVGEDVTAGKDKHIVWDFYADNPHTSGSNYMIQVTAHCMVCGQTIMEDFTLTRDIFCPGNVSPFLNIAAHNLTLNLGGYSIRGDISQGSFEGIIIDRVTGVTIRNGTIEGFIGGLIVEHADSTKIENMTVKNLDIEDHDIMISGIGIGKSNQIIIQDCSFEFLNVHHKQAISLGNSNATIRNIETNGGSVGVDCGGNVNPYLPSSGSIMNCRFNNSKIAGILVQCADSMYISNNTFIKSPINVDPAVQNIIRNIFIEDNDIQNCSDCSGIGVLGSRGVVISNNHISGNDVGISFNHSRGCAGDSVGGENCFYATGNIIQNNIVLGNNIDLFHCDSCLGNTWEGNTYETAHGIEVYTVTPATAKEYLTVADSVAQHAASDAQLLLATSLTCDSSGTSYDWAYIYESLSFMEKYEFRLVNGKIIKQETVTLGWLIGENAPPITESWIDSDSAIVITEGMGGKQFRESHDLITIEMAMHNLNWNIHYVSQDSIFSASFNAKLD